MSDVSPTVPPAMLNGSAADTKFDRKFHVNADWITRPLFGFALAGIAVAATVRGGFVFAVFLSLGCTAAAREWHRLFAKSRYLLPAIITWCALWAAMLWQVRTVPPWLDSAYVPLAIVFMGTACNLLIGFVRRNSPLAHAAGPIYIAIPALSLLMVRQSTVHALWVVVLFFLAVWSTDTGALFIGKLIGGPKLAPRLSPKKTWAGAIGGLAAAGLVCGGLTFLLHGAVVIAVLFGAILSVVGQAGDLFESLIKRRTGCKDSGGLIPGHGGVLDRIDSMLFAAPVAALLVLWLSFNPVASASP
ncbi:MAG: phosphatidate cytidylyltransferase [Alphaproteobacteria bacterium]|nr:phosphatidate cytidylyltransferase [Alphaproteobacteria bacterium]